MALLDTRNFYFRAGVAVPEEINLIGDMTGDSSEVIVFTHLGRKVSKEAHLCHITEGKYGLGIYDMPEYACISISAWNIQVKRFEDTNCVFVCLAERNKNPDTYTVYPNWL